MTQAAKKTLSVVSKVADFTSNFTGSVPVWKMGLLGVKFASEWINTETKNSEFFDSWIQFHLEQRKVLTECVVSYLESAFTPKAVYENKEGTVACLVYDFEGVHLGVKETVTQKEGLFLQDLHDKDACVEALRRALWKSAPHGFSLERVASRYIDIFKIVADAPWEKLDSEVGRVLTEELRSCQEQGVSQGVLLWGPPGTGKTSICRHVAHELGNQVIRVKASQLAYVSDLLPGFIKFFKPRVFVIDDIDRAMSQSLLLEILDDIRRNNPGLIVLTTANDPSRVDFACFRPPRFDLVMELTTQHDVTSQLLKQLPGDIAEALKSLSVAYIQYAVEFLERNGEDATRKRMPLWIQAHQRSLEIEAKKKEEKEKK